jgi:hypothetical protein
MNKMSIKKINVKDLNLPKAPAQAPQIDWGEDFLEWPIDQQNRYLKRLCSALNHATDNIQKERDNLIDECHKMLELVKDAEKSVEIQKNIVYRAITNHNEEKQELIKRLQELESEIKEKNVIIKLYEGT